MPDAAFNAWFCAYPLRALDPAIVFVSAPVGEFCATAPLLEVVRAVFESELGTLGAYALRALVPALVSISAPAVEFWATVSLPAVVVVFEPEADAIDIPPELLICAACVLDPLAPALAGALDVALEL